MQTEWIGNISGREGKISNKCLPHIIILASRDADVQETVQQKSNKNVQGSIPKL